MWLDDEGRRPQRLIAVAEETRLILSTFSFLLWGALVMWMCAGFTMLEAGSVRTKNASVVCLKNIGLYAIAGLTFYFVGYSIMHVGVEPAGWFGSLRFGVEATPDEWALVRGDAAAAATVVGTGHASMSHWFFQMVFVASAASIVSGTLAERVRLWAFFLFVVVLTAFVYPLVGAWTWGGGWLGAWGFRDYAGSTVVHSTGGWAALAGVLLIGARRGKFGADGSVLATPPSNVPAVTLGVFIIWLGFLGFNAGSRLSLAGAADAVAVTLVVVNTNLASAAGVLAALALSRYALGRTDLRAGLNGAIAGLVSIAAGPELVNHLWACLIGAVGGAVCTFGMRLLERLRIDDEVGAIPAHLGGGVWGSLAVCIAAGGHPGVQAIGIAAVAAFVFSTSLGVWWLIDKAMGARISAHVEKLGQDATELRIESFPEFILAPDPALPADVVAPSRSSSSAAIRK